MTKGLVSIIIPVFNHVEQLRKNLSSIPGQEYKKIEVIIVDDGSSVPVSDSDCGALGLVPHRIIRQENRGAPAARNRGLREAAGEYVIFWDADVAAPPTFLRQLVETLDANPDAAYAYTSHYMGFKFMEGRVFDVAALRKRNYIHSTALIRRRDAIEWDESLQRFQDWDLWLSMLAKQKKGVFLPTTFFQVTPRRFGMSRWLPRCAYYPPLSWLPGIRSKVIAYKKARAVIAQKHKLSL